MTQVTSPSTVQSATSFANCFLFRGLEPAQRDELFVRSKIRRFEVGQTIFLMGSPGDSMMAVLHGKVRISMSSAQGREIVLAILQDGEVFGEIAMLDGKERTADAQAVTDCVLAVLERRDVLNFLEQNPSAYLRLIEVFCQRMRLTDERFAEVSMLPVHVRLARTFLRLIEDELGSRIRHAPIIRLSQRELGNLTGATREKVNRCLRDWQKAGVVKVEDGVITILKLAGLKQTAEELA
jgi:CRP/FNR family cyclic AMP-dependent transcriptional regulator